MAADSVPRRPRASRLARSLFALADAPLVVAVGVGLAAAVLPSGPFWWAQLVAIGLPYAAWALGAMTLVAALLRWRAALVLHGALLALVVLRAGPLARAASPTPGPDDLRLMTFNLPQSGPSEQTLRDSAAAFVGRTEPDLLLLQDTWVDPARPDHEEAVHVASILERHPYRLAVPRRVGRIEGRDRDEMGVPLLVRRESGVEVLGQETIVPEGGPDVSVALRSHLRWRGREFVLYNLHLRSFGPTKPWDDPAFSVRRWRDWARYLRLYRVVYAQRGDEAEAIAARVAAETLPVVVAGDFNSTADNTALRRLQRAGTPRLDAGRVGLGVRWGRTYHAQRPLVRIDYVFTDPALEVAAADVLDVGFSDHRPVAVRLRWADDE